MRSRPVSKPGFASDVLLLSGGVSAGDYDRVEPALQAAGASFFFTQVAIKPGAPLVFGRRGSTLLFGLPGNPVSALVTFELLVRPCLLRMQGARVVERPRVTVEMLAPLANRSGRTSHSPARVRRDGRPAGGATRAVGGARRTSSRTRAPTLWSCCRPSAPRLPLARAREALLLGRFAEDDGAPV